MKTTKTQLAIAHAKHYIEQVFVAGFAGCFMPVFLMVMFGAKMAEQYHAPQLFDLDLLSSQIVYGMLTALLMILVTKAYLIRGAINFWMEHQRHHRVEIDRMKFGPTYFRK